MGLSIGLSSAGNPAYRSLQVFIQPVFLSWAPKPMRRAQRRGAVEQGCHRLPGQLLVGEAVGFANKQLAGEAGARVARWCRCRCAKSLCSRRDSRSPRRSSRPPRGTMEKNPGRFRARYIDAGIQTPLTRPPVDVQHPQRSVASREATQRTDPR